MKKLIVALGAVVVAASVQAATYNWSVMSSTAAFNGYDSTADIGKVWTGATATSGLSYYFIATATVSQSDLLDGLRSGKTMADYSVLASGTTTSAGVAQKAFSADSGLVGGDGKMSAYFAILSSDEQYVYLGATSSVVADTTGGQSDYSITLATSKVLRDKDGTTAYGSAGWYAVPEPTSGLLMLLGMAGLALRRRRA